MASATASIGFDRETLRAIREMTQAMERFSAAVERLERLEHRRHARPPAPTGYEDSYPDHEPETP